MIKTHEFAGIIVNLSSRIDFLNELVHCVGHCMMTTVFMTMMFLQTKNISFNYEEMILLLSVLIVKGFKK